MAFYINRFKGMETMAFDMELVTPMFMGGSDPKKAEIRAPSIKAALRFWWRAIYGSDDIAHMKKQEDEIFGSTSEKASFSIRLKNNANTKPILADLPQGGKVLTKSKGRTFPVSIIEYLAYGLCEYKREKRRNVYTKEHIPAGATFNISLDIANQKFKSQILEALGWLSNYGGLGARSRNGFGSFHINGLAQRFKKEGELKDFSSLSSHCILFDEFKPRDKWEDALSDIGKAYREARISLEQRHRFENRPLIAKPLIVKGEANINERHSKPYFLHVNKRPDGKYKGHILFMPYRYYDFPKRKEYSNICEKMNQKIKELSGGSQ